MYVIVHHKISDPATFWFSVEAAMAEIPEGMQLRQLFPNADGSQCVCLWSADSVDTVKQLVESKVGHVSSNEYYEVGTEKAIGLPE
jgi:hypothetical protein